MAIEYRKATMGDINAIVAFVDYWLTGGGKSDGVAGATHDYFVPRGRHESFLSRYDVMVATFASEIVGWAVKTNKGVLIHLLVAATFRGRGIGSELVRRLQPDVVRSKFDQQSGDPAGFYERMGFVKVSSERLGRHRNIDLFEPASDVKRASVENQVSESEPAKASEEVASLVSVERRRTIDVVMERIANELRDRR